MSAAVKHHGSYFLRFLFGVLLGLSISANAMTPMTDSQLSDISGQALLFAQKTVGGGNPTTGSNGITFYKMGLDGQIDINTNMNHLRLGCGGINGTGCDISIDNMALQGGTGPGSDAVLTRPYVELAVANDGSATARQMIGFRFSAESATGVLTTGTNTGSANGINTLSGYMVAVSGGTINGMDCSNKVCGTARTDPAVLGGPSGFWYQDAGDPNPGALVPGDPDWTVLRIKVSGMVDGYAVTDGKAGTGIKVPGMNVPFSSTGPAVVNGSRLTSTSVAVGGNVPAVSFATGVSHSCEGNAGCTQLVTYLKTSRTDHLGNTYNGSCGGISCGLVSDPIKSFANGGGMYGLTLSSNFVESLGFIHKITVNGSPFYLSFQNQALQWPGSAAADVAQPGWWMSFKDKVTMGALSPANNISMTDRVWGSPNICASTGNPAAYGTHSAPCPADVFPQVQQIVSTYFENNPINISLGQGWTALTGGYMDMNMPNMNLTGNTVSMTLTDVALGSTQNVPTNCWGAAPNTQPCFN